jgi:hypothetical protein
MFIENYLEVYDFFANLRIVALIQRPHWSDLMQGQLKSLL